MRDYEYVPTGDGMGISVVNMRSFYELAYKEGRTMTKEQLLHEMADLGIEKRKCAKRKDLEGVAIFTAEIQGLMDCYEHGDYVDHVASSV